MLSGKVVGGWFYYPSVEIVASKKDGSININYQRIWLDWTFIILVPYNTINWVHSDTGTTDQRARKKSPSSHQSNICPGKWRFLNESQCFHNQIYKVEKVTRKSDSHTAVCCILHTTRAISWFIWFILGVIIIIKIEK